MSNLPSSLLRQVIALSFCIYLLNGSQFYDLFRRDCAKISNEKTFDEGIDHWHSLFRNDSVIEMNDRIFSGSSEINSFFEMHRSTFRRIQFDVVGSNIVESADGILSITLYATYTPRNIFGCSSQLRWLAIFWYDGFRKITRMLLSSSTSLLEWREQLNCNWIANREDIRQSLNGLMHGMYRDSDVQSMVRKYYDINAKLYINDGNDNYAVNNNDPSAYHDIYIEDDNIIEGIDNIINWYLEWNKIGVSDIFNEIDEMDISGNNVVTRMVTMASHSSGKCSQSFLWYGLYRFNGKTKILYEQRYYQQQQLENAKLVLKNCGDLSPLKTDL